MRYLISKNGQKAVREALKSLVITSAVVPLAMVALYALVFGALAPSLGLPVTEVMLDFIGATFGAITVLQLVLLLISGYLICLYLYFRSDWVGASIPHLATTLHVKSWRSARLWPSEASGVYGPVRPSNPLGRWFEYWKESDIWRTPYSVGDCPQLE